MGRLLDNKARRKVLNVTGLQFRLEFPKGRGAARTPNLAALTVLVNGETVWPVAHAPDVSIEIPADDLLSHLVEFWAPLTLRQTYPVPVAATRPIDLRATAERRWDAQPAETAEREDAALCRFEEAHDLSHVFSGHFNLSPLFLLRRGDKMVVDTSAGFRLVDYDAAVRELTRLGDEIAERLEKQNERWSKLVGLWRQREAKDPLTLLARATGLTRQVAERLTHEGILSAPASFADIANDDDEMRIAARMAAALPPDQIGAILRLIAEFPKLQAPGLDALAGEVSQFIAVRYANRRAHEQGELAARRVRGAARPRRARGLRHRGRTGASRRRTRFSPGRAGGPARACHRRALAWADCFHQHERRRPELGQGTTFKLVGARRSRA
jgi:hypothetical protein